MQIELLWIEDMPIFSQFSSGGYTRGKGFAGGGRAAATGPQLYAFVDATFTNAGRTGRTGPSLSSARNALSGTGVNNWKNNTSYYNNFNGQQLWTVPATGTYRITAVGAGMWDHRQGGYGARMRGDFSLVSGEVIRILVGQTGPSGGGAAGGTFVVRSPYNNNASILVIAGGGGGGHGNGRQSRADANTGTSGRQATQGSSGGSNGYGGNASDAGAGAGFFSDGAGGGSGVGGTAYISGGYGGNEGGNEVGGFGGGGTSGNSHGGGGGGYSGGGSSGGWPWHGGGGGSYNSGSNQANSSGVESGNSAYVQIVRLT